MLIRPRRLRKNTIVRDMVAETRFSKNSLIYPFFVTSGTKIVNPINAMPGVSHFSIDELVREVDSCIKMGLTKFLLFGVGEQKTDDASSACDERSIVFNAVKKLKQTFGNDIYLITDVCACAYTTHGHCGILQNDDVQNDLTVPILAKMALSHAQAGADMVAPSDMMDGRVLAIRQLLDANCFQNTAIMSYAIKYASGYYGPFREAADSAPTKGDRQSYQMDYRNANEAMREALLDESEGADILMVKPALAYLDVIHRLNLESNLPIACYNVSGEYAMVKYAANAKLIDEKRVVMENMYAFARAGASIVITYHAKDIVNYKWI